MSPEKINDHIDGKIIDKLSENIKLNELIVYLDDNIIKFSKRPSFINVSKRYILNNWKMIDIKKRYTTYLVMRSFKRKKDIEWLLSKRSEFEKINPNLNDKILFNLLKLKENLK
jgi:hypothetical protein